jgi:hypothetical protein
MTTLRTFAERPTKQEVLDEVRKFFGLLTRICGCTVDVMEASS